MRGTFDILNVCSIRAFAGSVGNCHLLPKLGNFIDIFFDKIWIWNEGNNKQNNFAVEFNSFNYSIMYLTPFYFWIYLPMCQDHYLDSLSFPSMDILIRASKFLWVNLDLRGVLIKFIHVYEKFLSTEAVQAGMIFIK